MELIVTHERPDLDALASVALAALAHPGAAAALHGGVPERVEEVLRLVRDHLPLVDGADVDRNAVDSLVVVDTSDLRRLGPWAELAERVPVALYDHHPLGERPVRAASGVHERVGAAATLLVRHLGASGVAIPAPVASLALLGIVEDTGGFAHPSTRPADFEAAAALLRAGASLAWVRERARARPDDAALRALREEALAAARTREIAERDVAVVVLARAERAEGASEVADDLLERLGVDAVLLALGAEGRTDVIARSLADDGGDGGLGGGLDVGAALAAALGGGGHPGAASARSDLPPERAAELVLAALASRAHPPLRARDVMSAPVRVVAEEATVRDAQRMLARYGHHGAPVVDEGGRMVGIVSRRDLERALRHDLGRSRVTGFLSRDVATATPDEPLAALEERVRRRGVGRLPVVDERGAIVGIVSRSDLLAARHAPPRDDRARAAVERLPGEARRALRIAARLLPPAGGGGPAPALYLVGGTVRDALLGRSLVDLDLAVEHADAVTLGARLQRETGGELAYHAAFGTCTVTLPSGLAVDLATAREESYERPGALPEVEPGSLRRDLARRDFSINALAVRFAPEPPVLVDPFDGLGDLEREELRVLHPLSFLEDPTRVLRGARLAGRLGFRFAPATAELARAAASEGAPERVSASRLRAELELAFGEPRPAAFARALEEVGGMRGWFGLEPAPALFAALDALRAERRVPDEAYLLALLHRTRAERGDAALEAALERFHLPRRLRGPVAALGEAEREGRVAEKLVEEADPALRAALRALGGEVGARVAAFEAAPERRKLRGADVVELGLPPGPDVGRVLDEVAEARADARVASFEEEREMARALVAELLAAAPPEPGPDPETGA